MRVPSISAGQVDASGLAVGWEFPYKQIHRQSFFDGAVVLAFVSSAALSACKAVTVSNVPYYFRS
jgi:hypothetical protein